MESIREAGAGMRRRDLLKIGAAGGAVAWVAPAIYTSRAYAAGTLPSDRCKCRNAQGTITSTRKITSITLEWTAGDCTEPSLDPRCQFPDETAQPDPECGGDSTGVGTATVRVGRQAQGNQGCAIGGTAFQIRAAGSAAPTDETGATSLVVNSTDDFTAYFPSFFNGGSGNTPNLAIEITWNIPATEDQPAKSGTQTVCFHTSCSQSLCFGDEFGPLIVKSYTVTPTTCP